MIREEGMSALMKGSIVFSSKRVADWTTRFFFAELMLETARTHLDTKELTFVQKSACALLGGALSATVTIPIDVLVATIQVRHHPHPHSVPIDVLVRQHHHHSHHLHHLYRNSCVSGREESRNTSSSQGHLE